MKYWYMIVISLSCIGMGWLLGDLTYSYSSTGYGITKTVGVICLVIYCVIAAVVIAALDACDRE